MLTFIAFAIGLILLLMIGSVVINIVVGALTLLTVGVTSMVRFPIPTLIVFGLIGYDVWARAHGQQTLTDMALTALGTGK